MGQLIRQKTYFFDVIYDLATMEQDTPFSCDLTPLKHDTLLSCSFEAVHDTVDETPWLAFSLS